MLWMRAKKIKISSFLDGKLEPIKRILQLQRLYVIPVYKLGLQINEV